MRSNITSMYEQSRKRNIVRSLIFYLAEKQDISISFETLCHRIGANTEIDAGTQLIPMRSILGAMVEDENFDSDFNPLNDQVRPQWEEIAHQVQNHEYISSIKVYQIGSHYFVAEGHVIVSVYRYLSISMIMADVILLGTQENIRDTSERMLLAT